MRPVTEVFGPFPVYVPHPNGAALADIIPGSAIVGFPTETDPKVIHVFYEGNRHGIPDLTRFADRAKHAASRCRWFRLDPEQWQHAHGKSPPPPTEHGYASYPTSAQAFVPSTELIEVALYDDLQGIVTPRGKEEASLLSAWIGRQDSREYLASGPEFESGRQT